MLSDTLRLAFRAAYTTIAGAPVMIVAIVLQVSTQEARVCQVCCDL